MFFSCLPYACLNKRTSILISAAVYTGRIMAHDLLMQYAHLNNNYFTLIYLLQFNTRDCDFGSECCQNTGDLYPILCLNAS